MQFVEFVGNLDKIIFIFAITFRAYFIIIPVQSTPPQIKRLQKGLTDFQIKSQIFKSFYEPKSQMCTFVQ